MRPELAEQVALGTLKVEMYSAMPLKLVTAETHLGRKEFTERLAAVFARHRGSTLTYGEFLTGMGLSKEILTLD
jgi:hypothetical protein